MSAIISGDSPSVTFSDATTQTTASPNPTTTGNIPFTTNGTSWSSVAKIVSGTAQASTSGTSITFTGIPSWVKRITVMFKSVSTSSTSIPIAQLGSGSATTSGYLGAATVVDGSTPTYGGTNISNGFNITGNSQSSAYVISGSMVLTTLGSNVWICSYNGATSSIARSFTTVGQITLSGILDRVVITTSNGTDTFTAGSINILYE